ncbi:MAG: amino acid adenylation domain-containing protein [Planctomycetota bacterium]
MSERRSWLGAGFLESAGRFPDRPALEVDDEVISYADLERRAASLAASLVGNAPEEGPPLTAVFAHRSATAFAGNLAALFRGHGYVPLNPTFPPERTRAMLTRSGCRAVIVDASAEDVLDDVLGGFEGRLLLLFAERDDVSDLATRFQPHSVLGAPDLAAGESFVPIGAQADSIAYLLFTSGSTGLPKGVMVSHGNATRFVEVMQERYALDETDRLSQMFEMVFDLSVFDMFMAWEAGACVCCPSRQQVLLPADYVRESKITVWFSVPSTAILMKRLGFLEEGAFPELRLSLFCGEALPAEVATAWQGAAPDSVVENLYGPTEATVSCAVYRWDPATSPEQCENGIVPIGEAFPGMTARVVSEALEEVAPGELGELLMSGPQLALGYWKDPDKTAQAFLELPGGDELWYRTGDRVRRPVGSDPLLYLGRIDNQIKIHGWRVELGEIEAVLRKEAGVDSAVAVGWPVTPSGADGIVAFLEATDVDVDTVLEAAKSQLPGYMVPREIRVVGAFPLNPNGKIDRKALVAHLED